MKSWKRNILLFSIIIMAVLSGCNTGKSDTAVNQKVNINQTSLQGDNSKKTAVSGSLEVHFLDVGEGNAVLLENEGHYALIDGGVNEKSSYVVSYLKKEGVQSLDYIIASHYDADHLAGLVGALNVFPVTTVLGPGYETDTNIYDSFQKQMKSKGITLETPVIGNQYQFGNASMKIVGPVYYGHTDGNEDSVAVQISYGNHKFLIAGDAGEESEGEMVTSGQDLRSDVLLVNHHGSETSTSQEFLDAVAPVSAIISSGTEGNNYEHPREITLDRIKKKEIELYRTDKQGEIIAVTDGTNLTFSQPPCNDFSPADTGKTNKKTSEKIAEQSVESEKKASASPENTDGNYVLNKNTNKFHNPDCSSIKKIKDENKELFEGNRDEMLAKGYESCGICRP